jgi:lipopolysaccharide export system ATP-binding protein
MRNRDTRPLRPEPSRSEASHAETPRNETPRNETPKVQYIRRLLERTADQQGAVQNARRPDPARLDVPRPGASRPDASRLDASRLAERPPAPRPADPPRSERAQLSLAERFQQILQRPAELLRRAPPAEEPVREPVREPMQPAVQVMREPVMRNAPPREVRSPPLPRNLDARGLLAAADLQKSYGGRRVVNGVNLNVARGEAVGLLGPNGAGKTTVFYMVTGLVKADAGRIELDGNDVTQLPMYRRARLGIGYLPQEASIFRGLSVEDNILAVLEFVEPDRDKRMERLDALLDEFTLHKVRKSPSIALSGGERRRCEIARSLATNPSFMLLDEPFAGIDPIAVGDIQELVTLLTQRGIGVLITDHNVRETLGLVNRAYIVHSGTILMEGSPEEIVESRDVRRLYLGEEFRL